MASQYGSTFHPTDRELVEAAVETMHEVRVETIAAFRTLRELVRREDINGALAFIDSVLESKEKGK